MIQRAGLPNIAYQTGIPIFVHGYDIAKKQINVEGGRTERLVAFECFITVIKYRERTFDLVSQTQLNLLEGPRFLRDRWSTIPTFSDSNRDNRAPSRETKSCKSYGDCPSSTTTIIALFVIF